MKPALDSWRRDRAARLAISTAALGFVVAVGLAGASRLPSTAAASIRPPPDPWQPASLLHGGRLELARADVEGLQALPGIGARLAERIVAERLQRPLCSLEGLLNVPGIGPRTLERIRGALTIGHDGRCRVD